MSVILLGEFMMMEAVLYVLSAIIHARLAALEERLIALLAIVLHSEALAATLVLV